MPAVAKCPKYCISDFSKKCDLLTRNLVAPKIGSSKPTTSFVKFDIAGYKVTTIQGTRRFAGVNLDKNATHLFMTRFRPKLNNLDASGEHFLLLGGKYYRILKVTNIDESNEYILFQATERGLEFKEESNA